MLFQNLQVNIGGQKAQGYGIRTERYRLNRWFFNGSYQYELYDHKYDSDELYNLSKSKAYLDIRDSLSYVLSERVSEARKTRWYWKANHWCKAD